MTETADTQLVKDAQGGDRHAFSMLVERHYMLMYKTAWKFCGVREDAQDIAQEAAIKLANNIGAFRHDAAFTTWLYRLVINAAKDYYKAKNRKTLREAPLYDDVEFVSGAPAPDAQLEQKEVLKALAALPESLKETVILVCWQGMSHKEAAKLLGCSEGTISWRVHEARKKIAELIGKTDGEKRHG